MFDDLVVSGGRKKKANKWTFFLSFVLQALLLGVLILIPLIYTEAIDLKQFSSTLLVAPPPPPPPPPPPTAQPIARVKPIAKIMQAGKMIAPTVIPKQVAKIIEEDIPDAGAGVGVIGGVPGGVPGGQAGGILGGIIGGVTGSNLPPPPAAPKRIVVGGNVQQARLINQVRPVYPPLAKQARIQGTVRLQAVIARDGTIQELQVMSGHPLLVQSALDAVRQWRYQPTLLNGEPVEVSTTIDVVFTLSS
jgi:protein TonB